MAIRRVFDIPPLPGLAKELLGALADENVNIRRLAACIERDPGLTARIIGLANSAFYGAAVPVYTVADSITRVLGLNMVRSVALGIVLSRPFDTGRCAHFSLDRYWFGAVATAAMARRLAPHTRVTPAIDADSAYLCGLLYNFGLIVLTSVFPEEMSELFRQKAHQPERSLAALEEQRLGLSHGEAAGIVARKWHLPPLVVAVVENHANRHYAGEHLELCQLVALSARLIRGLSAPEPVLNSTLAESLGLSCNAITATRDQLAGKMAEFTRMAGQVAQG